MRFGRYSEDGNITLVEILKDGPDPERGGRTVKVRALWTPIKGRRCHPPPDGIEWESWAAEGAGPYCGWSLLELPEHDPMVVDYMRRAK